MLSWLRKKQGSMVIKGILIAVAVTFFSGFGLLSVCSRQEKKSQLDADTLALINGEKRITRREVDRVVRQKIAALQSENEKAAPDTEKIKQEAIDSLISNALLVQEADRLGIAATDSDLQQKILTTFQKDGVYDPNFLNNYLSFAGISQDELFENFREEIKVDKLYRAIISGVQFSDADVRRLYLYENQQLKLALIKIDPAKVEDVPEPTAEEIKKKYDADPEAFQVPEKRKIQYAYLNPASMVDPSTVTDTDIEDFYNNYKDFNFAIEKREVKVRKIYIASQMGSSEEDKKKAKEKADAILAKIKNGEATFEDLAKSDSADAETAPNGGDIGWVKIGDLGLPADRYLKKMKKGEVSDVIGWMDGFYIYMVEDDKPGKYKSLKEVRPEALKSVLKMKGRSVADERSKKLVDLVKNGTPFLDAAKTVTAEVKISGAFAASDPTVDDVEDSKGLVSAAFKLWEVNSVSDPVTLQSGAYVLQLTEIVEEHTAEYEEAVVILKGQLIADKHKEAAKKIADDILAQIKQGKPFEDAAKISASAELATTDFFARGKDIIPIAGYAPDAVSAVFALPPHTPVAEKVFEIDGKLYLAKVIGRKEAGDADYAEQMPMIKARLIMDMQKQMFESYAESLKKKAKIERTNEKAQP